MNEFNSIALKLKMTLMFIDLKVALLLIFMGDFYRNTALGADVFVNKTIKVSDALNGIWHDIGAPYVKWIPIVIIGDLVLKEIVERFAGD